MFYDQFLQLCSEKGVSRTKACTDIGLSRTAWRKWADGSVPHISSLNSFADYFSVPITLFLGEEVPENKENPTSQMTGEVDERINDMWDQLTPQEREYFFSQIKDYLKMRGQ